MNKLCICNVPASLCNVKHFQPLTEKYYNLNGTVEDMKFLKRRPSDQCECCCSACIRQLVSLYRLVPSFRSLHFHFRLRQAPS